jgi:alpha-L-rhamnosidase
MNPCFFTTMFQTAITLAALLITMGVATAAPVSFQAAAPSWPDTGGDDLNRRVGFRVALDALPADAVLRLATSGLYRATVDGKFLGHGPARAGHGHFRIDEWPLKNLAGEGTSVIGIEVAASVARSYYMIKQPAFLQAEIVSGDKMLATTKDFQSIDLHPAVVRKVPRYSYQRTFTEVFRPTPGWQAWRTDQKWDGAVMKLTGAATVPLAPRGVPYPEFKIIESKSIASGRFEELKKVPKRTYYGFHPKGFGDFTDAEMEARPDHLMSSLKTTSLKDESAGVTIAQGAFHLHDFGVNLTGFIGLKLRAEKPTRLLVTFDELRSGPHGSVDPHRPRCVSAIQIDLSAGTHEIETFEPYTQRYLQVHALDAAVTIERSYLRELAHPHASRATFTCSDPRFNAIFEAARQTFRQNATDIFMDCPSRERAGWLCDSFFTARVEADLTGASAVERNFLENYAQPDLFPGMVDGMLPMCYPSDPYEKDASGQYIPNWAMWFVLELEEYLARTGDKDLTARLQPKVEELMKFFARYENSDGLLEKLDAWVFVEWSEANKFVQDVNYPTNMLYAAALDAAARIYQKEGWSKKAASLRGKINEQSFDGTYYRDHAKRLPDGKLDIRPERTEVCQYYAFFFNATTPERRPELWKTLVSEFGPSRRTTKAHPEISPCNQLPGNMLRMEILSRYGETARIHDEALGYWNMMAETTGTLWEHDKPEASCNHGFASHAAVVLRRDLLGLREIDHSAKIVNFAIPEHPLDHCSGSFPTADGDILVEWKRGSEPKLTLPKGWKLMK